MRRKRATTVSAAKRGSPPKVQTRLYSLPMVLSSVITRRSRLDPTGTPTPRGRISAVTRASRLLIRTRSSQPWARKYLGMALRTEYHWRPGYCKMPNKISGSLQRHCSVPQLRQDEPTKNRQPDTEEGTDKEIFRKSYLQLRKSRDRLSGKVQSYHRRRLNQYSGHDQKPFQPADVHPSVLNLLRGLARLFNSSRQITSQVTNQISSCKNNRHVDDPRFEDSVSRRCRPTELGAYTRPARADQEPCQNENRTEVNKLIKSKQPLTEVSGF